MAVDPIAIVEVGPRDGLQNEATPISTADKIALIDRLSAAGLRSIEITAFVSPAWVPQMADASAVAEGITRRPGVRYSALTPNLKGLERAAGARLTDAAVFAAASETFSRRNINQSIDESFETYEAVVSAAHAAGIRVRGYLSTAFGCPYEGAVPIGHVVALTKRLLDLGVFEVALSDTIGVARPGDVRRLLDAVLSTTPVETIALHFHDTRGMAAANVAAAIDQGIRTFDGSAGGLGGCPYAPGAAGNVATEELLYLAENLGVSVDVSADDVCSAAAPLEDAMGHALPSRYFQAWRSPRRGADRPGHAHS